MPSDLCIEPRVRGPGMSGYGVLESADGSALSLTREPLKHRFTVPRDPFPLPLRPSPYASHP